MKNQVYQFLFSFFLTVFLQDFRNVKSQIPETLHKMFLQVTQFDYFPSVPLSLRSDVRLLAAQY